MSGTMDIAEEAGMIIRRLDARAIRAARTQLATLLLDAVAERERARMPSSVAFMREQERCTPDPNPNGR